MGKRAPIGLAKRKRHRATWGAGKWEIATGVAEIFTASTGRADQENRETPIDPERDLLYIVKRGSVISGNLVTARSSL